MAVIHAVIVPAKALKDGRHTVRISVAHNGETRYITTNIILDSAKEFKNGAVVKRQDAAFLNTKIRGLLQRYQKIIDEMEYINGMTCTEVVYQIKNGGRERHRTLQSIFDEYMDSANLKPGSIESYKCKWSTFTKYLDRNMLVDNVTRATVIGLEKFLRKRGLSTTSLNMYISVFMMFVHYATRCGYAHFRVDPFVGYKLPKKEVRQAWLSIEEIKRIRDLKTKKKNIAKCRDLFMLSYYLGGINMVNMIAINFDEQTDVLHYVRAKTERVPKLNKFVEFEIPYEAKEIINRYKSKNGHISVTRNQKNTRFQGFFINNLPKIAKLAGIKKLIYYSARKSFAQHAFNLGISTGIIDYILGHRVDKESTSLYAYISVTPEMATKAIRKVLDNLK